MTSQDSFQVEQIYPTIGREELISLRRQFIMGKIIAGLTTDKQLADAWNEVHPAYTISPSTVFADRKIIQDELQTQTISDARQVRNVLSARTNEVIRALHDSVLAGNLKAIDRYLKAIATQAQLFGANMPAKIAFTDTSGQTSAFALSDEEKIARITEMMERVKMRAGGHYIEEGQTIIDADSFDN